MWCIQAYMWVPLLFIMWQGWGKDRGGLTEQKRPIDFYMIWIGLTTLRVVWQNFPWHDSLPENVACSRFWEGITSSIYGSREIHNMWFCILPWVIPSQQVVILNVLGNLIWDATLFIQGRCMSNLFHPTLQSKLDEIYQSLSKSDQSIDTRS